jgi:AcrR family transcriptional regulator
MSPRGRRPAGQDTRTAILIAARQEFAGKGYDGSSLRAIARAAGVDPALVHHYFEDKAHLFAETMDIPARPDEIAALMLQGPADEVGERVVRLFFGVWDAPPGRERLVALLRSAVSHEDAARMLREFLAREMFGKVAASLGVPDPELRAGLALSQMVGVALLRYVLDFEPIASAPVDTLVQQLAPTIQRYFTG